MLPVGLRLKRGHLPLSLVTRLVRSVRLLDDVRHLFLLNLELLLKLLVDGVEPPSLLLLPSA